jgi:hypothetical protein
MRSARSSIPRSPSADRTSRRPPITARGVDHRIGTGTPELRNVLAVGRGRDDPNIGVEFSCRGNREDVFSVAIGRRQHRPRARCPPAEGFLVRGRPDKDDPAGLAQFGSRRLGRDAVVAYHAARKPRRSSRPASRSRKPTSAPKKLAVRRIARGTTSPMSAGGTATPM